jgi:two-component system chemotaxis response regulator CheB
LLEEHSEALEEALWAALRALEESGSLHRRLATQAQKYGNLNSASEYMESAAQSEQQANLIKRVLAESKAIGEYSE